MGIGDTAMRSGGSSGDSESGIIQAGQKAKEKLEKRIQELELPTMISVETKALLELFSSIPRMNTRINICQEIEEFLTTIEQGEKGKDDLEKFKKDKGGEEQ